MRQPHPANVSEPESQRRSKLLGLASRESFKPAHASSVHSDLKSKRGIFLQRGNAKTHEQSLPPSDAQTSPETKSSRLGSPIADGDLHTRAFQSLRVYPLAASTGIERLLAERRQFDLYSRSSSHRLTSSRLNGSSISFVVQL